jgi:DNA-binding winged helix-turn-helix (wHTH) protein
MLAFYEREFGMDWHFGPFQLDLENACLWEGNQRLTLRPKTFDILVYLVHHAGELVTRDDLLEAVWPATVVADGVLTTCIGELRKALGETAREPQYIATVHRRGYRFSAPLTPSGSPKVTVLTPEALGVSHHGASPRASSIPSPSPQLIEREGELNQLHQWFEAACQGQRQIVFLAGEVGIGKTVLLDAFLDQLDAAARPRVGRGQCMNHYGAGEAYLPLLDALEQVVTAQDRADVIDVLRQYAPSWLLQLPGLLVAEEWERLQQQTLGASRERMLRELAQAVEVLTMDRPLILVLDDLHWSDVSTLDWLAYVARRRAPARLFVIGAYRPVDAVTHKHPIRADTQDLRVHGQCQELMLT